MIDFYIVRNHKNEPGYNSTNDIPYIDLNSAKRAIDDSCGFNGTAIDTYYALRIQVTDAQEILNCIFSAGNSQGAKITKYRIVEIVNFHKAD